MKRGPFFSLSLVTSSLLLAIVKRMGLKGRSMPRNTPKVCFYEKKYFLPAFFFFFFLSREIKQKDFLRRVTGETHRRPTDASSLTTHWIHVLVYTHTRPISCLHIHKHTFKCRAAKKKGNEEKKREPDEQKNFNCFLLWKNKNKIKNDNNKSQ